MNISIEYKQVERFGPGSKASVDYLDEHGFVVIKNALSDAEIQQAMALLWDYLEAVSYTHLTLPTKA